MLNIGLLTYLLNTGLLKIVRLMNGVAVAPFELNIGSSIVTWRGEFVENTPEPPRSLCCEIGILGLWVPIV